MTSLTENINLNIIYTSGVEECKMIQFVDFFREKLPGKWAELCDDFQHILFLRCLRPDKVTVAMQDYVANNLGQRFIEPQVSVKSSSLEEFLCISGIRPKQSNVTNCKRFLKTAGAIFVHMDR